MEPAGGEADDRSSVTRRTAWLPTDAAIREPEVLWRVVTRGAVLCSASGEIVCISKSGLAAWERLDEVATANEVIALLADQFSVDPGEITEDILVLFADLADFGMITRVG